MAYFNREPKQVLYPYSIFLYIVIDRYEVLCLSIIFVFFCFIFAFKRMSTTYSRTDKLIADELRKKKGLNECSLDNNNNFRQSASKLFILYVCGCWLFKVIMEIGLNV